MTTELRPAPRISLQLLVAPGSAASRPIIVEEWRSGTKTKKSLVSLWTGICVEEIFGEEMDYFAIVK